jgi:hypothetical protein
VTAVASGPRSSSAQGSQGCHCLCQSRYDGKLRCVKQKVINIYQIGLTAKYHFLGFPMAFPPLIEDQFLPVIFSAKHFLKRNITL